MVIFVKITANLLKTVPNLKQVSLSFSFPSLVFKYILKISTVYVGNWLGFKKNVEITICPN